MSLAERAETSVEDADDGPAFERRGGQPPASALIYASPHSGRVYPEQMMTRSRLDRRAVRQSEDALVDQLIAPAEQLGASLFLARYGRAYVDVNREPDELDGAMFEGGADGARTPRVAAGLGVVPRVVARGRDIYAARLPAGEGERRIGQVWRPYHEGLDALTREARARFGGTVLIDWHSMPSAAARSERARTGTAPDVVLGDRFGQSCAPSLTAWLQHALEACGYTVVRNTPYAGGWTTERYGRPEQQADCLQVELNRALYLDEATLTPNRRFPTLQRDLMRVTERLLARTAAQARPMLT